MAKRGYTTPHIRADTAKAAGNGRPDEEQRRNLTLPVHQLAVCCLRLMWHNFTTVAVILLIPSLISQLGALLTGNLTSGTAVKLTVDKLMSGRQLLGISLSTVGGLWAFFGLSALYCIQVIAVRGYRPGIIETYRAGLRFLPRLVGLIVLLTIMISVGLLFLIVPGLIILRRYVLAPYFLVDEDLGIRQAMDRSAELSKSYRREIWSVLIVVGILIAATYGFQRLPVVYGAVAGSLLSLVASFLPGLLYAEIVLGIDVRNIRTVERLEELDDFDGDVIDPDGPKE